MYIATCLSALTGVEITEATPPEERGSNAVKSRYDPPPLGKPRDQHKTLIALRDCVHNAKPKVNWSPYVNLRRFSRCTVDSEGYVVGLALPECEVVMDLTDLGPLLGVKLSDLDLYYNEGLTGDLAMVTTTCPIIKTLRLGAPRTRSRLPFLLYNFDKHTHESTPAWGWRPLFLLSAFAFSPCSSFNHLCRR